LDYENEHSFLGVIYKDATQRTTLADLFLPKFYTLGSIRYLSKISVNNQRPYIKGIFPLKQAGTYKENEEIPIVVQFSHDVIVLSRENGSTSDTLSMNTTMLKDAHFEGGKSYDRLYQYPRLVLETGQENESLASAFYTPLFKDATINYQQEPNELVFIYVVKEGDYVDDLVYKDETALKLGGEVVIQRKSMFPNITADLYLRPPRRDADVDGVIAQQWLFHYPKKVEVIVRDLWHSFASDLSISLNHGNISAPLVTKCCDDKQFGWSLPEREWEQERQFLLREDDMMERKQAILGAEAFEDYHLKGVGYDYLFSDTLLTNLALEGVAEQSTTGFGGLASKGNDGNKDGFYHRGSVTHTGGDGDDDLFSFW
jgi:hypothetical protein